MTLKKTTLTCAVIALVLLAIAPLVSAQSLLDNDFYKKGQSLMAQSQSALDAGDYDGAAALAQQAKDAFAQSDDYVTTRTQFYRANGWLSRANDRVSYAKSIKADENYKNEWTTATAAVAAAKSSLDSKDYSASMVSSQAAIEALKNVAPKVVEAPKPPEPTGPAELPEFYTSRLILPLRDCFWRIAAYPFVYNDPWKWKLLYNANKSLLENPNNPNLIEVGVRFVIPSLAGETRSGDYDPEKQYVALPK